MTNEQPLSHYSRQWLGLVAAKAKLQPTRQSERWLLHLTPDSPNARTVNVTAINVDKVDFVTQT